MADCTWPLAPAAIPAAAKGNTLVRSNASALLAVIPFVPRADGSSWREHRFALSIGQM